jgi:hypothetical protein
MLKTNDSEDQMLPPEEGKSRGRELLALLNLDEQLPLPATEPPRAMRPPRPRLCSTAAMFVPKNNAKRAMDTICHAIWVTFTSAIQCLAMEPQESCTAFHLTLVGQTSYPETLQALTSGLTMLCPAIVEATPAPDASLLQLTLLLAERDQTCWEYFRHGTCPRPCCRWQHATPEVVVVVLHLLHPGGEMSCTDPWGGVPEQQQQQPQQQTPWVSGAPHAAVGMKAVAEHPELSPWADAAVEHRGQGNCWSPIPTMNSTEVTHCPHATPEQARAWPHAASMMQQGPKPVTPRGISKTLQASQGLHIPPIEVFASTELAATRTPSPELQHPYFGRMLWADLTDEGDAVWSRKTVQIGLAS